MLPKGPKFAKVMKRNLAEDLSLYNDIYCSNQAAGTVFKCSECSKVWDIERLRELIGSYPDLATLLGFEDATSATEWLDTGKCNKCADFC